MIGEVDIYGVYLTAALVLMLVAYLFCLVVTRVFDRVGLYRFVWHRSIFDLAIYVIVLGVVVIVSHRSEERRVGKECRSLCDWSSDVCSSDLAGLRPRRPVPFRLASLHFRPRDLRDRARRRGHRFA